MEPGKAGISLLSRTGLFDLKGQRTGYKTRYIEETLMWGHWVGSTILFRPEIRFDHAFQAPAYDRGSRHNQFQLAMDVIFKYYLDPA